MPTLKYYGHSAFRIQDDSHTVFVDPFITGNPVCKSTLDSITRCDYVLLTHAHGDHYGDVEAIAKTHEATVICTWELAKFLEKREIKAHPMSTGGGFDFPFGRVEATIAFHGCGSDPLPDGTLPPPNTPVGFIVQWGQKKVIYHAGDTALFSDMKLIGEKHKIDVACLPIGDNFTMGPIDAAKAVTLLDART